MPYIFQLHHIGICDHLLIALRRGRARHRICNTRDKTHGLPGILQRRDPTMPVTPALFHKMNQLVQNPTAVVIGNQMPEIVQILLIWTAFATKQLDETALKAAPGQGPTDEPTQWATQQILNQQGAVHFRKQGTVQETHTGNLERQRAFLLSGQKLLGNTASIIVGQKMNRREAKALKHALDKI